MRRGWKEWAPQYGVDVAENPETGMPFSPENTYWRVSNSTYGPTEFSPAKTYVHVALIWEKTRFKFFKQKMTLESTCSQVLSSDSEDEYKFKVFDCALFVHVILSDLYKEEKAEKEARNAERKGNYVNSVHVPPSYLDKYAGTYPPKNLNR